MGPKTNNRKAKSNPRQVELPNAQLRNLYEEQQSINTANEILSRLDNLWPNICLVNGRFHPIDTELIWLIIGSVCDQTVVTDNELQWMGKIIENKKLYQQFDCCRLHIVQQNIMDIDKKRRLERLLTALCKVTTMYMAVASDLSTIIRPNFFLDLYYSTRNLSVQVLEIKPRIFQRLEYIHFILTGKELQEDSEIENKVVSQPTESNLYDSPPDDIENWNVVPAHRDILRSSEVFLRPNFVACPYPDLETYKDVQFRLLMEDFMAPLRDGVAKFVNKDFGSKGIQELRIYEVISLKILHNRHFVPERETSWRFYSVQFKVSNRINWATSRRLINGSLVCLWDGVNELVIASVANSNPKDLALGRVVLVLETHHLPSNITKKYVMLESAVFFEPYRAVLKVLQNFTYETFPMMDYFLGFEKNQLAPSYIEKAPMFTLQLLNDNKSFTIRNMMDFSVWPDADELGLDKRQHVALLTALTSRVSLVQGPPGTGKTFLALRILRSLLDNKNLWQGKFNGSQEMMLQQLKTTYGKNWYIKNKLFWKVQGAKWRDERAPVVVICFTNHALDQFLEGISDRTDKIIRIGGQSKSDKLKNLNLNQIKHLAKSAHDNGPYKESTYFYYFHRMKEIRAKMEVVYDLIHSKIRVIQSRKGFKVDELQIKGIISAEICDEFLKAEQRQPKWSKKKSSNILDWWLGWSNHRQLLKLLRETRMDTRKAQVIKTSVEMKQEKVEEDLPDDIEVPDRMDDDMIEDLIDDEDYREELRLAKEQADVVASPEYVEEKDEFQQRLDAAIDQHKEQSLIDFAKNQMQRMQLIRDLLLNRPTNTQFLNEFISADQILKLPLSQRWMLFAHWKRTYHDMIHKDLMDTQTVYEDRIKEFNQLKGEALAALCRTADVVGMTTTGAAKNRLLLESLKAKIVIVEEAAEVLESHIVCSLTPDCQQLILIGDHQQLRPSVNVHQLATKFKLDVSLFERLIKGDMKPAKLGVQHRMRAEVARLIVPVVYAHLENHTSV